MSSHDRLRRRGGRPGPEPQLAPPAPDPRVAALLALQRTAGNQAVLQRLVYDGSDKKLAVPQTYGERRIPWNREKQCQDDREAKPSDPTLLELAKDRDVRGHIARGMDVQELALMVAGPDDQIRKFAPKKLAEEDADDNIKNELVRVALAQNELLMHWSGTQYSQRNPPTVQLVQSPEDYLPQEPDLAAKGVSVRSKIPGKKVEGKDMKYWEYTCVLIALVKAGGYATVERLTKQPAGNLDAAVQALHDHYVGEGVQYDDSSTRFKVMRDWGYKLIFAGSTAWADLPAHVELTKGGNYIFDVVGHTVKVDVQRGFTKGGPRLADPRSAIACDSDPENFVPGNEYNRNVTYIWAQ